MYKVFSSVIRYHHFFSTFLLFSSIVSSALHFPPLLVSYIISSSLLLNPLFLSSPDFFTSLLFLPLEPLLSSHLLTSSLLSSSFSFPLFVPPLFFLLFPLSFSLLHHIVFSHPLISPFLFTSIFLSSISSLSFSHLTAKAHPHSATTASSLRDLRAVTTPWHVSNYTNMLAILLLLFIS